MISKPNAFEVFDLILSAALIGWFFVPLPGGASGTGPESFSAWNMALAFGAALGPGPEAALSRLLFATWLAPLFAAWRVAVFFTRLRHVGFLSAKSLVTGASRIIVTGGLGAISLLPVLVFADSNGWFAAQKPVSWGSPTLILAINIASVCVFLARLNRKNPIFLEYRAFRKTAGGKGLSSKQLRGAAFLDVFFRIRSKLFFAFIGIISVILLVLSVTLLRNYRTTIMKAVADGARSQVEQASAAYRVNLGDSIAMVEYMNRQVEMNRGATFTYHDLTVYTDLSKEVYLDDPARTVGDYRAEFSTLEPATRNPELPALSAASAAAWLSAIAAGNRVIANDDPVAGTVVYTSPIVKIDTVRKGEERIRRERLLGFSVMTFDRNVIMRPYYRTRVTVILITAFFIYLSVVLTYLVGNYIVNPLLFLRMNVRKIADILSTMIHGETRVAASALVYNDCVTSRDEIKSLSFEINEMVSVIRGIVPYISASTLKNAESGATSTSRKELAFLFTDIRGFTTMCEGMEPEEVVTVLNRYLDLETEIILNNHGDVDKFVGDEMMAFFEGPMKEMNACRAAMEIRHAMMEEKERREKEGLPVVSIGIGINVGPVVFGSVGARDRMDFTSIGDTVNLAARLEGANKAYGSKSLITEAVYEKVKEEYLCREIDMIAVKGKTEPVRIFEVLQEKPRAQPKLIEIKTHFEKGLEAYRRGKWEAAQKFFAKNVDLFGDAPSAAYLERVRVYAKNPPPPGWDGVFRMTVK